MPRLESHQTQRIELMLDLGVAVAEIATAVQLHAQLCIQFGKTSTYGVFHTHRKINIVQVGCLR
jgi:hypothetical protein